MDGNDPAAAPEHDTAVSLEDEGEMAADYLEELLDIADIDGDIDIDVKNGRAQVAIVSDDASSDLGTLVGRNGEVLDALQELTRLTVQTSSGNHSRLMLDVDGFRDHRRKELESVAAEAIEDVKSGKEPVALKPMNAYERKVVHDAVAEAGYRSESAGQDSGRHVVVYPA
nr:R3H domain-containing nucleic acid-binding protein [Spelaeicoccus albus]